jgi:hypothetical protein
MSGGGSKPGERRGGRKPGTPNKLPKGERALLKLDNAEAQVRALKAEGLPLETLGKERLTELDAWAHSMAKQFAPKKDEKTGRMLWENDGDEARFLGLSHRPHVQSVVSCLYCMKDPQAGGSHGKPHRTTKILSHAARRRGSRLVVRTAVRLEITHGNHH